MAQDDVRRIVRQEFDRLREEVDRCEERLLEALGVDSGPTAKVRRVSSDLIRAWNKAKHFPSRI